MNVSPELDIRFRDAAAAKGLLDVAYDLVDSPLGALFVGVSDRGLCVISYDTDPERKVEQLARGFGSRVLRSPHPIDPTRRQLDEYFEGRRQRFDLEVDLRLARDFGRLVLRDPVPIVLPCHRVVGSTGSLVGYAGGLERKQALLKLEGALLA
jgi:methylated-DNA-[protein]-cysteine S-methyltransferase